MLIHKKKKLNFPVGGKNHHFFTTTFRFIVMHIERSDPKGRCLKMSGSWTRRSPWVSGLCLPASQPSITSSDSYAISSKPQGAAEHKLKNITIKYFFPNSKIKTHMKTF